jgi:hypothetical protein
VREIFGVAQRREIALVPVLLDQILELVGKGLRDVLDREALARSGRAKHRDSERRVGRGIR